jgi:hypothetical protein
MEGHYMKLLLQKSLFLIQAFTHLSCDGIPVSVADPDWIRVKAFQNVPRKENIKKILILKSFSMYSHCKARKMH